MLKKFVPLTANDTPSKNPYEVRTYLGDNCKQKSEWKAEICASVLRKCPPNNTIAKILTIEDEIRRIHQKAEQSRFQRPFKLRCALEDDFVRCVVPQRTPRDLRTHAVMRENFLRTQRELASRVHDAGYKRAAADDAINLESPVAATEEEEEAAEAEDEEEEEEKKPVKPEVATPTCSLDAIYMPTDRILELTRPQSGLYHNETEPPVLEDDGVNYSVYNPRNLQEQLEAQNLGRYDLIQGKTPMDLWTWNIGKQERDSELDRTVKDSTVAPFECDKAELKLYKIPDDLDKTFRVQIVMGPRPVIPFVSVKRNEYFNRPPEIAAIYVAYVDSFRLNPDFWVDETMEGILATSEKLLKRSETQNYKSTDNEFDILPQITERNAVVGLKIHYTGPLKSEPNIFKALSLYFSKYNAAVLCSQKLFLLIWKRCSTSFYVFDPNGRNENCERDFEGGMCSLIAIDYVEHLVHLILNYSQADINADFNLYEIFLINYGKITNPMPTKPYPKLFKRLWTTVTSQYAIIPAANTGLSQPITGNEQNNSMIVSLLALLYSDIERAKNWTPEILDELNKYGTNYFKNLSKRLKLKKKEQLNAMDLPKQIQMGAHKATFTSRPFLYTGHVTDCRDYHDSQLTLALKDLFNGPWQSGLLQIDNSVIGVWRDRELYYAFDPFRRGRCGQVLDPDDYRTKGVACLQMHATFDSFCRIIYENALKLRRGGKFFLHGIGVGCIKPLLAAAHIKNRYPALKLDYPSFEEKMEAAGDGADKPKGKKAGKGKLARSNSIQSLPLAERLEDFTAGDVVNGMLEEILCEIISALPEPQPSRTRPYRQAESVLLQTDRPYLDKLKHDLVHKRDEDNMYPTMVCDPMKAPTLEEELAIPSNYEMLPDGTWVIFGTSELPMLEEDTTKLGGLLAGLITAALSAKYKISTWNADLIEYALESVNSFGEGFDSYEPTLAAFLNQKLPRVNIGRTTYEFQIQKILHGSQSSTLRQMLLESLICYNRLLVICQRFSCVIFKRYNFLYMFLGYACNPVGYRKFGPGPACMLRFIELDALIRRIEFGCDPHGCEVTNYVVVALKVKDVTTEPPETYRPMIAPDERVLFASERARVAAERKRRTEKLRFVEDELRRESKRIEKYLAQKRKRLEEREQKRQERLARRRGQGAADGPMAFEDDVEYEMEDEEMEEEAEEEEEEIGLKHKRGRRLQREVLDEFLPRPVIYGYHMRHKDCLYKIQGTVALPNRPQASVEEIKPCFFASAVAILYAVLKPLNQWSAARVDRVVNTGVTIASRVSNMTTAYERIIKNITADDYTFDIWVKTFDPETLSSMSIKRKIERTSTIRRYMMIQTSNCTYTIYIDEFFHLFDPYGSMEKTNEDAEEEEDEGQKKHRCPRGVKKYCERNTASWVLFPDIDSMLKYIDRRVANPDWRKAGEYKFHVVDIVTFKKAEPKERILQLLTDMEVSPTCGKYRDEEHICARPETLAWLDLESCLPVWSRLNRRNTAGRYRGIALTKLGKYDIEIDRRLWSLWGCLSPYAPVFDAASRGKQFLACNVVSCLAASLYRLANWSPQLMDNIVISGDKYHRESLADISRPDYEFSLEDLGTESKLGDIRFAVHLEYVAYGKLYCPPARIRMNLADALMYFFSHFKFGILQCQKRSLAIGRQLGHDGGYFMFDCQSRDHPLFPKGQGAAYLLRTTHLQVLLYCIVVTLNVPYYNVPFTLHKVELLREGALVENTEEEEN